MPFYLVVTGGVDVIKIKGSKSGHGLTFNDFIDLLERDYVYCIKQEKWIRAHSKSTIFVNKTTFNLKVTENKRAIVWHLEKFADTKPYKLSQDNSLFV